MIEPHTHDRERRTSQCVVCVFVSFVCLWVGGWVCVRVCVRVWVEREARGTTRLGVGVEWGGTVCCICAGVACVCAWVRLGGGGGVFVLVRAGVCSCVRVCVCLGAARRWPSHRRCASKVPPGAPALRPFLLSVCLPAVPALPACSASAPLPPQHSQPSTSRAPGGRQPCTRRKSGQKSG